MLSILNLSLSLIGCLNTSNEIYAEMKNYLTVFEKEKRVLEEVKCLLLRNEEPDTALIRSVKTDRGYLLYAEGIIYEITVEDRMITKCEISYS